MDPPQRARPERGPWIAALLVGVALWGLHRLVVGAGEEVLVVSAETVAALGEGFARRHGRAPTPEELDELVDDHVEQELLLREARAQGLDRADPIVRRRLIQKMQFVLEDAEPTGDPGDAALEAWLSAHAEEHRRPPRRGFSHAFVAGQGAEAEARARELAEAIERGADPATLGDPFPHGAIQPPVEHDAIEDRYGEMLAQAVAAAPTGRVVVVRSSFGWHALRVDEEHPGRLPALAEIRPRVLADWRIDQRTTNLQRGLDELRAGTAVVIEGEDAR